MCENLSFFVNLLAYQVFPNANEKYNSSISSQKMLRNSLIFKKKM